MLLHIYKKQRQTISAKTTNVKEELKENASDIPKSNRPENVNDLSTDHIDAVDRNKAENNIL